MVNPRLTKVVAPPARVPAVALESHLLLGQRRGEFMPKSRWFILAVLFAARFALGYQFQSAGSAAPFLVRDLGIDYAQVGILVGIFILPGIVISLPSGFLGRQFGDKTVVVYGMALMVAGGCVATFGWSYPTILFGHAIAGVGGAILIVLMSKMLTDWFAGKELFLGNAIFIVGWPAGIAAGQATQSWIAEWASWHSVFALSTALVALSLVLMILFYHRPPELAGASADATERLTWSEVRVTCLAGVIWMLMNGAYLVILSFGPLRLIERGTPIGEANTLVSLMSWVCIVMLPLGGYLATRYRIPNIVMTGGLVASILLGAMISFVPHPLLFFLLLGTALGLATPVVGSLAVEALKPSVRGPGFGIYYLWYFGGMPVLLALAGLIRDWSGSANAPLTFATGMLLCCLILAGAFRLAQARARQVSRA
jgi:predicted MFS family arabinose efflux permease